MSLSTLKGEALVPYVPPFIKEGASLFDSVEHFIEEMCPVLLPEKWIFRYYTGTPLPKSGNVWDGIHAIPAFYEDIADFYGVEDATSIMDRVMLVMSVGTLHTGFVRDRNAETRNAFDQMHSWCNVRYIDLSTLLPIGQLSSYDRWKLQTAGGNLPYSLFNNWAPEVLHSFLHETPEGDENEFKPVVLVVRNDYPCTMLEICQTFEATVIKHWLGRLLPVLYKETGFDLNARLSEPSSVMTWLKVLSRHCGNGIFLELFFDGAFERPKTYAEALGKMERVDVIQSALVRFTDELLNSNTAITVPARRSSPIPVVVAREQVLMERDVDEEEIDEEEEWWYFGSIFNAFPAMKSYWDILAIVMAIVIGIAAANSNEGGTSPFVKLLDQ